VEQSALTDRAVPPAPSSDFSPSHFLDAAQLGTLELNAASGSIHLSPTASELMGVSAQTTFSIDELLNRITPEDRQRTELVLRGGAAVELCLHEEFRCVGAGGVTRWIELRGRWLPNEGRAAGVLLDVTDRHQRAESRVEQDRVLDEVLEALPIGVWLLGKDGQIIRGNSAVKRIWSGWRSVKPDEFGEYRGWWADSGEPIQAHEWAAARAIEQGETSLGEVIQIQDFDGNRKTIVNCAVPLLDDRGEIAGAIVTNQDITHQREIEEALRDSEERFRSIFNQSAISISVIGLDGRFIMANPVTHRLLGYADGEMAGITLADVIHPADLALTSDAYNRMLRGAQESYQVERRYVRKDGSFVWGRATTSVVRSGDGAPKYFVTVAEDVSERKRAEEAEANYLEHMRLLAEIAAELLEATDVDHLVERICERVAVHVGVDACLYHSVSDDRNVLELGFCRGISDDERLQFNVLRIANGDPCDSVMRSFATGACCSYPIQCKSKTVGALTFAHSGRTEFPTDALDFLLTVSNYVGLALERIRLTGELNERIGQYGQLIAAQREIAHAEPDLPARMGLLAARLQQITQSSGAGITRIEDEHVEYIAGSGTIDSAVGQRIPLFGSLVGLSVRENRPLRSDDTQTDPRVHQESCRSFGIRSIMAVPLQYNSTTVGALTVVSDRPNAFNDDHMAVAEVMSSIVVAAMSAVAEAETREALSTAEERLRMALEGARIGIWSWDIPADSMYCSPEACVLMGHDSSTPMTAKRTLEHVHPEDRESASKMMRRILAEQSTYEMEHRFSQPDGSFAWVAARGRVIRAVSGTPIRVEGVLIDITEQKRLQEQLLQAQKMEGIGRLAGGIAHDFNNLLSVILGYTELIQMDLTDESPIASSLKNIQSAATRAATLTKQLLAFARRQASDPKVIDLNELIRGIGDLLKPLLGEHIDLRVATSASPSLVKIDPNQMEQVIVNLAVNARDAMPSGGSLLLSTDNIALEGGRIQENVGVIPGEYVRLSVSDTGHGMTQAVIGRIFEPFFTTKERGKGTGLGLATCYGIVRQNGGYIWPYSEPGIGTTFKVFLPQAHEGPAPSLTPAPAATAARGSATVLVVEDEELVRQLVVGALRNSGYTVLEAEDGTAGLDAAARFSGPIHLLLTDLIMPRMGGEELAERLGKERPEMRIAFVSGYSEDMATLKGLLPPDTPLFEKPIAPSDLLARIAVMLGEPASK
jgi:PAS domain S-box-containing protein